MRNELSTIDQLGAIRAQLADLKKIEAGLAEAVKREILARDGDDNGIEGALFRATLSCSIRESIDVKRLRAERPDIAAEYVQCSPVETLKLTARRI